MIQHLKLIGNIRSDADHKTGGPRYLLLHIPTSFSSKSGSSVPRSRATLRQWVDPAAGGTSPYSLFYRLLLSAFCLLISACGYHVAGQGARLSPDVKTIAIPIFVNKSPRYKIEQTLSGAITREFIERTKFKITPDPVHADAVLRGTVTDVRAGVVAFDLTTGRATTLQISVVANVQLVDSHTKKVLFSNPAYVFREEYQISQSAPSLFEEDQPALQRLSQDLARTLVTDILENF